MADAIPSTTRRAPAAALALALLAPAPLSAQTLRDEASVEVEVGLPGAEADDVARRLTPKLENYLGAAEGLGFMVSLSRAGQSRVILKFKLHIGAEAAARSVDSQLGRVRGELPAGVGAPRVAPIATAAQAIAYLGFASDVLPVTELTRYVDSFVRDALQTAPFIEQVRLYGVRHEFVRLRLDGARLAAYGVALAEIRAALAAAGIDAAPERSDGAETTLALAGRREAETLESLVVKVVSGAPIRLRDVAAIERAVRDDGIVAGFDGRRALLVEVIAKPGTDRMEATRGVHRHLRGIFNHLPVGVAHKVGYSCDICAKRAASE